MIYALLASVILVTWMSTSPSTAEPQRSQRSMVKPPKVDAKVGLDYFQRSGNGRQGRNRRGPTASLANLNRASHNDNIVSLEASPHDPSRAGVVRRRCRIGIAVDVVPVR